MNDYLLSFLVAMVMAMVMAIRSRSKRNVEKKIRLINCTKRTTKWTRIEATTRRRYSLSVKCRSEIQVEINVRAMSAWSLTSKRGVT